MDLSRYQSLLTAIASQLSTIGDEQGARCVKRWLQTLEELKDAPDPNLSLKTQVAEVQRSAPAVVLVAIEHHLWPSVGGLLKQTDLESALDQLLSEAAKIAKNLNSIDQVERDTTTASS